MGGRRIHTIRGNEPYDALLSADMLAEGQPGVIDLHGMTVAEAREALDTFLGNALADGTTLVKVIHGKGQGTLAMFVRDYLNDDERVKQSQPSSNLVGAAVVAELA